MSGAPNPQIEKPPARAEEARAEESRAKKYAKERAKEARNENVLERPSARVQEGKLLPNARKVAIVGSRELRSEKQIRTRMAGNTVVISGGARGVDFLAESIARELGLTTVIYPAEWDLYGMSAGYRRNRHIIAEANEIIAFWDGRSRGTASTIRIAKNLTNQCA